MGCAKDGSYNRNSPLLNTQWTISYIQNTKTGAILDYPADAMKKISVVFTDSLDIIEFSGICNGGQGKYSFSVLGNKLHVTDLMTTEVYCKYIEWEIYVALNLGNAYKYRITGNSLEIFSNGDYNLVFYR